MKALVVLALLALTGCATTQAPVASAPTYPAWLEMKPGYAEACATAGKCTPYTDAELMELANQVATQVLQMCARSGT